MNVFNKLAPFIQDYIYRNGWEELRGNQVAACEVIFDSENNLLLTSGTASGKTEAAFLPTLTELYNKPSKSIGIMYISPLKSLINDQFKRLEKLLSDSNITVTKWHGDSSFTQKNRIIRNPTGIIQITPESLDSLVTNKMTACLKMFSDLRFIIIDEVHYFMRDIRGVQLLCLLERLQKMVGINPRRIGLSATVGDVALAQNWLNTGTGRECFSPVVDEEKKRIGLHIESFVNYNDNTRDAFLSNVNNCEREQYEYLYMRTLDKKTIIFTNSREEAEYVIANLKEIAFNNKSPDVYRVHHGNVSALIREDIENELKAENEKIVTSATVTLELGIDIGTLDQAIQIGAPYNVSSFAQRLGRCGRQGQVAQLLFTFVETIEKNCGDILGLINWDFIRTIAIIELYIKKHWVEPTPPREYAYNLLYHQTMSYLKSKEEASIDDLVLNILSLGCFRKIPKDDYNQLLSHLIGIEQLQVSENGKLIIGKNGENVVNKHSFLTVFITQNYFLVKDENRTIGTVDRIYPIGFRFSLAGLTWETVAVNPKSKVIFVKRIAGISVVNWEVDFENELHTILVQKIQGVLLSDECYAYLSERCSSRLNEIRLVTRNSGILKNLVSPLTDNKYVIFPWVGTRQLTTLNYALIKNKIKSKLPSKTSIYLEVIFDGTKEELENIVKKIIYSEFDLYSLPLPDKIQLKGKYNEFIPQKLLRKQFIEDYLDFKGLKEALN